MVNGFQAVFISLLYSLFLCPCYLQCVYSGSWLAYSYCFFDCFYRFVSVGAVHGYSVVCSLSCSECRWVKIHHIQQTNNEHSPINKPSSLLILMLLVANLDNTKWCKNLKNDWNPGKWVLILEYSSPAIQWIPTWQGLNGFQKSLRSGALDERSLSIERVKCCLKSKFILSLTKESAKYSRSDVQQLHAVLIIQLQKQVYKLDQ